MPRNEHPNSEGYPPPALPIYDLFMPGRLTRVYNGTVVGGQPTP